MKYKLIAEEGTELLRIRALVNIGHQGVRAGDLGGLVNGDKVLSQEGSSWITDGSVVTDDARVWGDAYVGRGSTLTEGAGVGGNAKVYASKVSAYATLNCYSVVTDSIINGAAITGSARVSSSVVAGEVRGSAIVNKSSIGEEAILSAGTFEQMQVDHSGDFLQIFTWWGHLTLARAYPNPGIRITVGCQVLESLAALGELASAEGTTRELELLPHFMAMAEVMINRFAKENPA